MLEYHASILGVELERSPKYHPEIAGEGIEYAWALTKMNYRRMTITEKSTKDSFRKLAQQCIDNKTILDIHCARKCSA